MEPRPFLEGDAVATVNLPAYAETGDSSVEWLGDVPAHWEVKSLKRSVLNVVEPTAERPSLGIVIALENVESWTGRVTPAGPVASFDSQMKRFRAGDVLFGKLRPYLAKVARLPNDGLCVGEFLVLRPRRKTLEGGYLEFLLRSKPVIDAVAASTFGARMPRANWQFIGAMAIARPPLAEQVAIVRFLEYVDRRIQQYMRAKEKLIGLLEEQDRAVIHRAVTGQTDVRTGQPYPEYKDSGVGWLGQVPAHWTMKKIRQCASISGGMTPSMEDARFWNGDVPWVTPKDMKTMVIDNSRLRVTDAALAETPLRLVQAPAVLMVVRGMILARRVPIARTTAPVTINQDMKALRPSPELNAAYMASFLDCAHDGLFPLIDEAGHGTRRLPTERWRDLPMTIPPQAEQTAISRYVDHITTGTTTAIDRTRRQISVLREWHQCLIADVVTGKLDVRKTTTTLPEVDGPD